MARFCFNNRQFFARTVAVLTFRWSYVMARFSIFACAVMLAAGTAQPALADTNGWYFGPFAMTGLTDQNNAERSPASALAVETDTDNMGLSGGAGLWGGYQFDGWALELGTSYRARHDANFSYTDITSNLPDQGAKGNVQTLDFMLSGLYDLPVNWKLQPYIGGGAGMSYNSVDTDSLGVGVTNVGTAETWEFAWQLQGGVKYPLGESSLLRIDYRYVDLGRMETAVLPNPTSDVLSADLHSHDARVGMTWAF